MYSCLYIALYVEIKPDLCHGIIKHHEIGGIMSEGRVEDIYEKVKNLAVSFRLRPGDRVNEVALARELGVSRTPLREVLNRLVAEKLFDFQPGAGFFCRPLDAQTTFDLYELRRIIEVASVRLVCERASDADLLTLKEELYASGLDTKGKTVSEVCSADEAFHMGLAKLSGNDVLATELARINDRIRFIRWIGMAERVHTTKGEHTAIMEALLKRDSETAAATLEGHIAKRMDQVVDAVKEGISTIYMDSAHNLADSLVEEMQV